MGMDYMPRDKARFDEWLENFAAKLPAIAAALGLPPPMVTAVTDAYAAWDVSFDAKQVAENAYRSAIENNDEDHSVAKDAVRPLVGMLQNHPDFTNAQREELGVTVPDTNPTPTSPEYVANLAPPLLLLDWSKRSQALVHFGVNPSNEKLNAKPTAIAGAKIWYRIESGPWNFVADDTNSPYLHNLAITEPLNVEYRAQWYDKKGRTGPFSETAKCTVSP